MVADFCQHGGKRSAIEIAREHGVAVVGVRNNIISAAGIYTSASSRPIGLATTTTRANIAPSGGITAILGNNPISIAVPRRAPTVRWCSTWLTNQAWAAYVAAANGQKFRKAGAMTSRTCNHRPERHPRQGLAAVGEHRATACR